MPHLKPFAALSLIVANNPISLLVSVCQAPLRQNGDIKKGRQTNDIHKNSGRLLVAEGPVSDFGADIIEIERLSNRH